MSTQNYSNHTRVVPGFHIVLGLLLLAGLVITLLHLFLHWLADMFMATLMFPLLFIIGILLFWYLRQFAIKAQDRAISAEESLRYFILTGKAIDSRITMAQIIALRFAPDEEFLPLVEKAAAEGLSQDAIKKEIKNWRADNHRA